MTPISWSAGTPILASRSSGTARISHAGRCSPVSLVQTWTPMWSSQQVSRLAICRRGLVTPLCFFDAHGNVVAGNDLAGNGFFGNPTNGDFANAGLSDRRAGTGAV